MNYYHAFIQGNRSGAAPANIYIPAIYKQSSGGESFTPGTFKFAANNSTVTVQNNLGYQIQYSETATSAKINLAHGASTPANLNTVYLHGVTSDYTGSSAGLIIMGSNVNLSGKTGDVVHMENLFKSQSALVDASGLKFGSMGDTFTTTRYSNMFNNCTNLVTPPPLIDGTRGKYNGMFYNCRSLTTMPEIRGVAERALKRYEEMFAYCTSLTTVTLPQANYGAYVMRNMFKNCTGITTVNGNITLKTGEGTYQGTFSGCTNLVNIPTINTEIAEDDAFKDMFKGCKQFNWGSSGTPYIINVGNPGTGTFSGMFSGNSGTLPGGDGTPANNTTYYYT